MPCHLIRSHIANLPLQQIFCTRDLLHLSSRANVDQTLFRMARKGLILRLTRGVYVRDLNFVAKPSEVAAAKAVAFGKKLVTHAADLLVRVGLAEPSLDPAFAISGRRSGISLASKDWVCFAEECARKLALAESKVGGIMRSIWYLRKENCTVEKVQALTDLMGRDEHAIYPTIVKFMPAWLSDYLFFVRNGCFKDKDGAAAYWAKFASAQSAPRHQSWV
jgi:hypothetical protein